MPVDTVPSKNFKSVFTAVQLGRVDFGMLPIENSLAGSIHQNYDLLQESRVWIAGEYKLRVSHNLLGIKSAKLSDLKHVYSHPQALSQCAKHLEDIGTVEPMPYFDTAGSAQYIAKTGDPTLGAIASRQAAKTYGLKIIEGSIEDNDSNFTRFLLIESIKSSKAKDKPKAIAKLLRPMNAKYKTSIVFALKNIPGCLHKCLSVFAIRDIDLYKIESRPIPGSPWKYLFYLDFKGSIAEEANAKALAHLKEITEYCRLLGSYPECRTRT